MLTQVELAEQAAIDGDLDTVASAEAELARLESELSKFIGQNTEGKIVNTLATDEATQLDGQGDTDPRHTVTHRSARNTLRPLRSIWRP